MSDQPKPVKTEQEKVQEFYKRYQALCQELGYQMVSTPALKLMSDTNTFGIVQQHSVGKLPKQE